jgi:FKBP-type peptidyl-prolyl cis-trans isomerase FklB
MMTMHAPRAGGALRRATTVAVLYAVCALPLARAAETPLAAEPPAVDTEASYRFGLSFGEQLRRFGISSELSLADLSRGVADALAGKAVSEADMQQLGAFLDGVRQRLASRNRDAAQQFLASNAKAKGVRSTASGLQYRVLAAGNSRSPLPVADSQVTVHYRGTLLDGSEFDSSYSRGQPATFGVDGVIKGWQEALVMMRPGAKWELFIPPDLAYGDAAPPAIPPGSLLRFEVELLAVSSPAGTR